MDKIFDSHWALRITALILATSLFFYVQSLADDDTESTASIQSDVIENVPLEVYYDEDNLIVTGLPKTVDVKIEGPMQFVLQAKLSKDYKVFVDLNSLLLGEHNVTIKTENFSEKLNVTVDPATVDILIEERVAQEFKVEPEFNTREIADNYELDSLLVEPETVMISGAKSVIDSINYVKASIKSEGNVQDSFDQDSNVIVLNKDLNKLDVVIEPSSVKVKVKLKEYTKDIPIVLETTGSAKNIVINSLTLSQDSLKLSGSKSILDGLKEITAKVNLDNITSSGEYEVILSLPDGTKQANSTKIKAIADVTAVVEDDVTLDSDIN